MVSKAGRNPKGAKAKSTPKSKAKAKPKKREQKCKPKTPPPAEEPEVDVSGVLLAMAELASQLGWGMMVVDNEGGAHGAVFGGFEFASQIAEWLGLELHEA